MPELSETYACVPSTERGRGILISGDPKSNAILYTNGRSVIIRYLHKPLEVSIYGEHAYQATVARFSPNGEWIASADVSGTVRIWGTHNDHVLKKEFRVLSGRIDDLQWSADGMRIVVSGDGKGKSFVRAFMWVVFWFLRMCYWCCCVCLLSKLRKWNERKWFNQWKWDEMKIGGNLNRRIHLLIWLYKTTFSSELVGVGQWLALTLLRC